MDYLKYYSLEKYLFGDDGRVSEIRNNFLTQHYLSPEDFFCIVIWKANRAKTKIKKRLLERGDNLEKAVKDLTSEIYNAKSHKGRLKLLLSGKWGFSLPMATAILTVLYHKDFSIYDVRVRTELRQKETSSAKKYFSNFLPAVERFAKEHNLSLRNADRYLWGKSFCEDLKKLVE